MALLTVRKDDDPILRKISKPVTAFDEKLKDLAQDMIETMIHEEGVGLAAVQIGKLKRMLVYDQYEGEGSKVIINPVMVDQEGAVIDYEACLSVTETFGRVERPEHIRIRYQNLQGEFFDLEAESALARILCHEMDHLDGVLFIDKMLPEPETEAAEQA